MADNTTRRARQKKQPIRVIVGNPPYSVGQGSANDDNQNVTYPTLDGRIRETYAAKSNVSKVRSLYDSYIRAIRWASDRIGQQGVIGFVTNAGFVDSNSASGLRKCLAEEFSNLYVFHLRGNQRTSGETSRKEGGKIFGTGSRAPVAITILVKNPTATKSGIIYYHDIGDNLSREQKLAAVARFGSVGGIERANAWVPIVPDEHGDWVRQRDGSFSDYIAIGDKKTGDSSLFSAHSRGMETRRDAWCYNASKKGLSENIRRMAQVYEQETARFQDRTVDLPQKGREGLALKIVTNDPRKISWTPNLLQDVENGRPLEIDDEFFVETVYRPFSKSWAYSEKRLVWSRYRIPNFFPKPGDENRVIVVPGPGENLPFSTLMLALPPDGHALHGGQCFPRYIYGERSEEADEAEFLREGPSGRERRDAITDKGLEYFQAAYPSERVTKDDVFCYTYGLLHSPEYRARFADNLSKQLPRIPLVKHVAEFWKFVQAGRQLGELHVNFEDQQGWPGVTYGLESAVCSEDKVEFYRVDSMRFAGKRPNVDKSTILYNSRIRIVGIPLEAYGYVVNGRSAIEWVMERQCVNADKASGIVNDANAYANETKGDPEYPLKLLMSVITVSMKTLEIVRSLPKLEGNMLGSGSRPSKPLTAKEVRSGIMAHWGQTGVTSAAMKIVESLSKLGRDKSSDVSFGDIVQWLGQKELTPDILSALNILVGSEFSILRARGYFLGENNERYELTPDDFRQVFRSGSLKHPRTGEPVHDVARHVIPVFELSADMFSADAQ